MHVTHAVITTSLSGFIVGYNSVLPGLYQQLLSSLDPLGDADVFERHRFILMLASLAGSLVSLCCPCMELMGRRSAIAVASLCFVGGCLAIWQHAGAGYAARMLTGLGAGFASVAAPLHIAECAPADLRGTMVLIFYLAGHAGELMVAGGTALLLLEAPARDFEGWRCMMILGATPAVLQLVLVLCLPESPRWLLQNGQDDSAREVLMKLHSDHPTVDAEVNTTMDEIAEARFGPHSCESVCDRHVARAMGVSLGGIVLQQLCGAVLPQIYCAELLLEMGHTACEVAVAELLLSAVAIGSTVVALHWVDTAGRATLFATSAVATCVVASALTLSEGSSLKHHLGGEIPWVLCAELFPLRLRFKAMCLAVALSGMLRSGALVALRWSFQVVPHSLVFPIVAVFAVVAMWYSRLIPQANCAPSFGLQT